MVALTLAAVLVAIVVGLVHKWLAPERQARIDRAAEAAAAAAVADFERDVRKALMDALTTFLDYCAGRDARDRQRRR